MVLIISENAVLLHERQLVGQGAAFNIEVVCQLLTVIRNVEGVTAISLDALRKVRQKPLADALGAGVHHPAGELQILSRAQRQQIANQLRMAGTGAGAGRQHLMSVQKQYGRIFSGDDIDHKRLSGNAGICFGKGSAGVDAAQYAVVSPNIAHFDDDAASPAKLSNVSTAAVLYDSMIFVSDVVLTGIVLEE